MNCGPDKCYEFPGLAACFLTKNVNDFHVFVMRSSSFDGWLACTRLRLSSCLSRIRSVVCVCRACRVTVQAGLRVCLGRRVRRAISFCKRVWRVKVYLRPRQRRDSPAAESALHPHSSGYGPAKDLEHTRTTSSKAVAARLKRSSFPSP